MGTGVVRDTHQRTTLVSRQDMAAAAVEFGLATSAVFFVAFRVTSAAVSFAERVESGRLS